MTALRERMIEDLQLRGLSTRTQDAYVRAVRMLAEYFHRSPDTLSEEELRQYFVYVKQERHWSRSTMTQALCGIKFFYEQTLKRSWSLLQIVRPGRSKQLPDVLAREEIRQLLQAVRRPLYRICLLTIYSCGLRITEGCTIQVPDIDGTRMLLHVRHGKGDKDRFVPLPQRTLEALRQLWRTHHHQVFLFPSGGYGELQLTPARHPISPNTLEKVFRLAYRDTGLTKSATVHTLRHSYATHLLEAGISLRQIQAYLGHTSLETTARYTHLTSEAQQTAYAEINQLMAFL